MVSRVNSHAGTNSGWTRLETRAAESAGLGKERPCDASVDLSALAWWSLVKRRDHAPIPRQAASCDHWGVWWGRWIRRTKPISADKESIAIRAQLPYFRASLIECQECEPVLVLLGPAFSWRNHSSTELITRPYLSRGVMGFRIYAKATLEEALPNRLAHTRSWISSVAVSRYPESSPLYGGLGKAVSSRSSIYDRATRLPGEVLRRHNRCAARCICPQQSPPVSALTHCKRNQVIHEAAAEDPIAHCARPSEAESCQQFDHRVRFDVLGEGRASVVQKI